MKSISKGKIDSLALSLKTLEPSTKKNFMSTFRQEKRNIKFWIWFELFKQEEYPNYSCKRVNNTKIWVTSDNIDKINIEPYEFSKEFQENPQINQAFVDRIK